MAEWAELNMEYAKCDLFDTQDRQSKPKYVYSVCEMWIGNQFLDEVWKT